jgi:hypothetical protein
MWQLNTKGERVMDGTGVICVFVALWVFILVSEIMDWKK